MSRVREAAATAAILCIAAAIVIVSAIRYGLASPASDYNDSNYYYAIGAASVFGGETPPRFEHPGANVMLGLGWFFAGLHAIGVLPVATAGGLRQSASPLHEMSRLLLAARLFECGLMVVYLALIYLVAARLFRRSFAAALSVLYAVLVVGVLEQMFIVRPEPLSAVLFLLALLLSLAPSQNAGVPRQLTRTALIAALVAASVMAKLLAVFLIPLLAPAARGWRDLGRRLSGRRYLMAIAALAAVDLALALPWLPLLSRGYLGAFGGIASFRVVERVRREAIVAVVAALSIVGAGVAASLLVAERNRFAAALRAACLLVTAVVAGALASLLVFFVNAAQSPVEWGRQIVFRAIGGTVGVMALGVNVVQPPALSAAGLLNPEIRHLFTGVLAALVICIAGFGAARRDDRFRLGALAAVLFGFSIVITMRGYEAFVFYYQIFTLIVVLPAAVIAARNLPELARSRTVGAALAVLVTVAVAHDGWATLRYRDALFAEHLQPVAEMKILDYFGGDFLKDVLEPRYCGAALTHDACVQKLAACLGAEQRAWSGWRWSGQSDPHGVCAAIPAREIAWR